MSNYMYVSGVRLRAGQQIESTQAQVRELLAVKPESRDRTSNPPLTRVFPMMNRIHPDATNPIPSFVRKFGFRRIFILRNWKTLEIS